MAQKRGFTLATLKAAAAKYGATVDHNQVGPQVNCMVDAPTGKVLACSGDIHSISVWWRTNEEGFRNEAIADALSRMAYGLADCADSDCDVCHDDD